MVSRKINLTLFLFLSGSLGLVEASPPSSAFFPLGDLPGDTVSSAAKAVSADGRVVAVDSRGTLGGEACLWTEETGLIGLGELPGGRYYSNAQGISADGSTVVGYSSSQASPIRNQGFRWSMTSGMLGLADLPGGDLACTANRVSAYGTVIVGTGTEPLLCYRAARWVPSQTSAAIPMGLCWSGASDVSDDGRYIVGGTSTTGSSANIKAYRWNQEDGLVYLGQWPAPSVDSQAHLISGDGRVVYGRTGTSSEYLFRWTQEDGMQIIFDEQVGIQDTNVDGTFLIGAKGGWGAYVWDAANDMRHFEDILRDSGIPAVGWGGIQLQGISADGRSLCGWGENPEGNEEGFLARVLLPGDINGNARVESTDAKPFSNCMAGPDVAVEGVCSMAADLDGDEDVDLDDFGALQRLMQPVCAPAAPDLDGDCAVTDSDLAAFAGCMSGPDAPTACPAADVDLDGDTDLIDFVRLQRLFPIDDGDGG